MAELVTSIWHVVGIIAAVAVSTFLIAFIIVMLYLAWDVMRDIRKRRLLKYYGFDRSEYYSMYGRKDGMNISTSDVAEMTYSELRERLERIGR